MRVLLVSDVPMIEVLGAGRVQLETAEALRLLGHRVTTYDPTDAFGTHRRQLTRVRPLEFARRASAFVRGRARDFDVIDAVQTCLPYSKPNLGFNGCLVSRSIGLAPLYAEYVEEERRRWPEKIPGTWPGQALHMWSVRRLLNASLSSYRSSDVVRVLNDEERRYAVDELRLGNKVVQIGEGLPDAHLDALGRSKIDAQSRLDAREVAFVGAWSLRKGAADWPGIIAGARAVSPNTRFSFLGTGVSASTVVNELGTSEGIRVVPQFQPGELPGLIAEATVGGLPTYAEGYGLGVVELLAAGVPVVAYDAPGPQTILRPIPSLLVPRGDTVAFAERLVTILGLSTTRYDDLARRSVEIAGRHRLSDLIGELVACYEAALADVRGGQRGGCRADLACRADRCL